MSDEYPDTPEKLQDFADDLGRTISKSQSELAAPLGSAQRTSDIENLRTTIKILERQDREIELETARFFLREMKNKSRQPLVPNAKLTDAGTKTP